jgi:hypothetical protein
MGRIVIAFGSSPLSPVAGIAGPDPSFSVYPEPGTEQYACPYRPANVLVFKNNWFSEWKITESRKWVAVIVLLVCWVIAIVQTPFLGRMFDILFDVKMTRRVRTIAAFEQFAREVDAAKSAKSKSGKSAALTTTETSASEPGSPPLPSDGGPGDASKLIL